jgi:hypothetical protein
MMYDDPLLQNLFQSIGLGVFGAYSTGRSPMTENVNFEDFNSSRSREEGNRFYRVGKYYHAIISYTRAYTQAEEGTKDVGLALANRSAVLLTVGFYKV